INRGGMARQGKSGVTLLSAAKNICVTRIFLLTFPTKTPRFSERNSLPQREQAMTDKFIVSRAEAVKRLSNRHAEACERFPYTREISLERYIKRIFGRFAYSTPSANTATLPWAAKANKRPTDAAITAIASGAVTCLHFGLPLPKDHLRSGPK